ncbi:SH3 domain-containing protein [Tolypothrix sp. FACHB-123]|uniref:SH3 domain-containing protein n=1 Tax=Tolypothrix sp. FACHB-123 TaxID=2692868 RepID=UPI0016820B1B|nr:SH3 domain-containing protein [Tolypothrix sp. FACHB-123]MBD2357478.1 SH3 domain-containing protein [Tolypothrix sp. FACHB-123]
MFKVLMASALIFAAALPVGAQEVRSGSVRISQNYVAYVCTNDVGGTLTLRTGPGTNYKKIRQIPAGNKITVIGYTTGSDGFEWFRVNFRKKEGWVRSDYVCNY